MKDSDFPQFFGLAVRQPLLALVRRSAACFPGISLATCVLLTVSAASPAFENWDYPVTKRVDVVDNYHGTEVADPYRWLEDANAAEVKAWVESQNAVTKSYLDKLPLRQELATRLKDLWNYPRFSRPARRGSRYFYSYNDGLQNQSVLYVAESLDGEGRVLLDPNKLSKDGTVALSGSAVSDDGKLMAYALSDAGSDWKTWYVLDVDSGEKLSDEIKWVKFSGASWTNDGKGFYYSAYDPPKSEDEFTGANYFQKLYYHKLGTPQSEDKLIYERQDEKEWGFGGDVTEDGKFLTISVWRGTQQENQFFYQKLNESEQAEGGKVVELINDFSASWGFIGNVEDKFYFLTDDSAPLQRVVAIDINKPDRADWLEIVPEQEKLTLRGASLVGGRLILTYLKDASTYVEIREPSGKLITELKLPAIGSAGGFGGRQDATEAFYSFTNFTTPGTIYRLDLKTLESTVFREPKVDFDPDDYVTKLEFVTSKDGTKVPLFITHRKDLDLTQPRPTILYGYGGFNISMTPSFSVTNLVWMEQGGVYAQASLRGGGEYGRSWHEAGMTLKKQNVFDDFIGSAEWLIKEKITSPKQLAIRGGSNGGLLVGACMTQRPDLFAACVPAVGVMDMLRFHKFTIGWAWVPEYGSSENAEQFPTLRAYSPLHNLKPDTTYPATLVVTGDHDDRVVPAHSFKFAAALQNVQPKDGPPTLIRIETRAGHGAGKPIEKLIEEAADVLAFLIAETKAE